MTISSPAERAHQTPSVPFRRLPAYGALPRARNTRGVDIDVLWSKVIAVAARNWMEELHVAGAFSDRQAPALNRAIRNRIYEVLVAWRLCVPAHTSNRFTIYLCDLTTGGDPEWPRSAVSRAVAQAIHGLAAAEFIEGEAAAELEKTATAGAQSAVDALLCFDEQAQRQVAHLISMIPDYWEAPQIGPDFRTVFEST